MVDVTRWIESSLHDVAADQRAATPAALPGVVGCSSYPASCCPGPRVAAPAARSESSAGAKHDGLAVNEDTFHTGTGVARLLVANSTAVESCDAGEVQGERQKAAGYDEVSASAGRGAAENVRGCQHGTRCDLCSAASFRDRTPECDRDGSLPPNRSTQSARGARRPGDQRRSRGRARV